MMASQAAKDLVRNMAKAISRIGRICETLGMLRMEEMGCEFINLGAERAEGVGGAEGNSFEIPEWERMLLVSF